MRAERVWALALALVFLAGHLPWLAPALEDVDSLNFALGLRDFNPALHQPHPPGYPLFIALGKVARAIGLSEAQALAVWGPLFAAAAIFALLALFRAIDGADPRPSDQTETLRSALATGLTVICPLFWFTAVRPMSDVSGLAVALVAQALLGTAFWRQRVMTAADRQDLVTSGRLIVLGAFVAALALGFRIQTIWLTAPILLLVVTDRIGRDAAGALLGASMSFAIGTLLWAIPMVAASGGLAAYLGALGSQAGEDFVGVDMLVRNPTPRRLAMGLVHTFIAPWGSTALGVVIVVAAVVGATAMLMRARIGFLLLAVLAAPYAVLHLLFQETVTTRYALPLMPALCYLAVRALSLLTRPAFTGAIAGLAVWSLWIAVPAVSSYAGAPSPVFQAMRALETAAQTGPNTPVVGMHYVFTRSVQVAPPNRIHTLQARPRREWMEIVRHWLRDGSRPVWFLADPMRTDLALIDPASRTVRGTYRWPSELENLVSGVRPTSVDWIEFNDPGWFLAEGWSVTPETAGVARVDGLNPARAPIVGYLRRRVAQPVVFVIGGRNLRPAGESPVVVTARIDGHPVATLTAPPGFFVHMFRLPEIPADAVNRYARVEIQAVPTDPGAAADVAIEQFNVQSIDDVVWGFDAGWHEPEFNPGTGRQWRWTSERAETIVHEPGGDLLLTLAGESPLRYFPHPANIVVRAGRHVLAREAPADDFAFTVRVPAAALTSANGRLTIETDETFVPGEESGSPDKRRLGLRIWTFEVRKVE